MQNATQARPAFAAGNQRDRGDDSDCRTSDVEGEESVMGGVMNRLLAAMNAHDLDAFVACFAPDYRSEQPAHPSRAFEGSDKVRENWTSVFSGVADFNAELLLSATTDDGVEIGEWHWRGTHSDGSLFAMRGVTVMGIEGEQIAWGRLYMEVVERSDTDIDQMVRDTYRPSGTD
jgi:ketosteroid isomerase-like protein